MLEDDIHPLWWEDQSNWRDHKWRAQDDNVIGGWCVTLAADARTPADGCVQLGNFMTKDVAEHVTSAHNTWLVLQKAVLRAKGAEGNDRDRVEDTLQS